MAEKRDRMDVTTDPNKKKTEQIMTLISQSITMHMKYTYLLIYMKYPIV